MGLQDPNGSRQLYAIVHLSFYFNFRSLNLSLVHTCFGGVLYAMSLEKLEIISRVQWSLLNAL